MKVASAPAHTQGSQGVRRAVVALLTLALAVRVGAVVATPAYLPLHDDRDYDRLACWISAHGAPPDRVPPMPGPASCAEHGRSGALTAYRPPLWPLALGGSYAAAEALGVPRWTAGRLLQAVLGTIVVALTGAIAARLWNARVGLLAMALGAVFLPLVLDGTSLISEPLFVALELGALLAVLEYRRRPGGVGWAVAAGALAGLAALTRSNGTLLAVALLVGIAARPRGLLGAAAFAAAVVLVVAPWTIRNTVVLGTFIPVSTETGGTLLGTYNATARDAPECTGCWVLMSESPTEMGRAHRLLALTEVERDRESRRLAARFALDHPGYVLQVAWANSVRLLDLAGTRRTRATAESIDVPPGVAVVGAWQLWVIIAVVVVGAGAGALRGVPYGLLALVAFLWLTTVVVQGETPRFRAALDPFLLMLAALSLRSLSSIPSPPSPPSRARPSPPAARPRHASRSTRRARTDR